MPEAMLGVTAAADVAVDDVVVETVIQGMTLEGKPFRPSDCAERAGLAGILRAGDAD